MTSFYCTDVLTTPKDLEKIYFMDSDGNMYYQFAFIGRYYLDTMLTSCTGDTMKALSEMVSISIPANGYAYLYQDDQSPSPNMRLSGDYYTVNLDLTSSSTGKYSGQLIIDYFSKPDFAVDCNCAIGGTNADMCGNLYNTKKIGCAKHVNDKPPNHVPIPRSYKPNIERSYSTGFWTLIWLLLGMIIIILIIMMLLIIGVFDNPKTELKSIPPQNMRDDRKNTQISPMNSEFPPGF